MLKKRQVVLAETINNQKAILAYLKGAIENLGFSTPYEDRFEVPSGVQMHLMPEYHNVYVLGGREDKIGIGDWVYNHTSTYKNTGSHIYQILDNSMLWCSNTDKIIATSDIELYNTRKAACPTCKATGYGKNIGHKCSDCGGTGICDVKEQVPQLSMGFMHKYVEFFCKEKQIKEVLVDYDEYGTVKPETAWIYAGLRLKVNSVYIEKNEFDLTSGRNLRLSLLGTEFEGKHLSNDTVIWEKDLIMDYMLKVDPKDNTITVKRYKGQWNRAEHEANIWAFAKVFVANTDAAYRKAAIQKWITDNL